MTPEEPQAPEEPRTHSKRTHRTGQVTFDGPTIRYNDQVTDGFETPAFAL